MTASVISHGDSSGVPSDNLKKVPSNIEIGTYLGIHHDVIKSVRLRLLDTKTRLAVATIESSRKKRSTAIDTETSVLKEIALDWSINNTRDSPNPDDVTVILLQGKRFIVTNRYLNVQKGELYFMFIRDIQNIIGITSPSKPMISQTIFLKWLREWKFIKKEGWHVCICMRCFNVEQFVQTYRRLHKRVHFSRAEEAVPLRTAALCKASRMVISPDSDDSDSDHEPGPIEAEKTSDAKVECLNPRCLQSPFRKPVIFTLPSTSGQRSYERTPSAIQLLTTPGVMCQTFHENPCTPSDEKSSAMFSGLSCAEGRCNSCGVEKVISDFRCSHEHDSDPSKILTVKTIDTKADKTRKATRPHFKTTAYTREEFMNQFAAVLKEFVKHYYVFRHQRRLYSTLRILICVLCVSHRPPQPQPYLP